MKSERLPLRINFTHGMGDCTMFAHQLPLYSKAGWDIEVGCNKDKEIFFRAAGVKVCRLIPDAPRIAWDHPPQRTPGPDDSLVYWNKAGWNLSTEPMPNIGAPIDLWEEHSKIQIDIRPLISQSALNAASGFLGPLPKPIVLLHTKGNSFQATKSWPTHLVEEFYEKMLDKFDGTLVLLDWDNRVPRLNHFRLRHLTDDWERIDVEKLFALLLLSDLLIGIDSGPLHAARFTGTPTLGIFWHPDHHPARYCLPRDSQVCIVPKGVNDALTHRARLDYNILQSEPKMPSAEFIANCAIRMLKPNKFLPSTKKGGEMRLQHMIYDYSRGRGNEISKRMDRDRGWQVILEECSKRFENPRIVETGCIRTSEDWRGAGNSTVLLGEYAHWRNGTFISIDHSEKNCALASKMTAGYSGVQIHCSDSIEFLSSYKGNIDLIYLDSMDTFDHEDDKHTLREAEVASRRFNAKTILVFDDTAYSCRRFVGKGSLAVPHFISQGWQVLFSGYQTALVRIDS